jgi:hypothetical protein
MLATWNELTQATQKEVRRRFVHWRYDPTSTTFEDWAYKHAFYVCKDGQLDNRYCHCEPSFMAEGDE